MVTMLSNVIFLLILPISLSKVCYDHQDVNCKQFERGNKCKDPSLFQFLRYSCPKSCKMCDCIDKVPFYCQRIANRSLCGYPQPHEFERWYCRKSCNLCGSPPTLIPVVPPASAKCGVSLTKSTRVVTGSDVKRGSWPWQALIYANGQGICGGSLISDRFVLTAAHCVSAYKNKPNSFNVLLGDHDITAFEETERAYYVERVVVHENYSAIAFDNDVAVIRLDRPVIFTQFIQPVCLPSANSGLPVGSKCFTTGWGSIIPRRGLHHLLQQARLTIVSNQDCSRFHGKRPSPKVRHLTRSMFCAGDGQQYGPGICKGDSGGPLVCPTGLNDAFEVHGVAVWGSPKCDASISHSVLTRVSRIRNWIDQTIKEQ